MMNSVPEVGVEGGYWGSSPMGYVEGEKVAERKKHSKSQKGIWLQREFAARGTKSSKIAWGVGVEGL